MYKYKPTHDEWILQELVRLEQMVTAAPVACKLMAKLQAGERESKSFQAQSQLEGFQEEGSAANLFQ